VKASVAVILAATIAGAFLAAGAFAADDSPVLTLADQRPPATMSPQMTLLGYRQSDTDGKVPVSALVRITGMRVNHLIGHGLVVGLQNTGDTQESMFTIQLILNMLERDGITLPPYINPIQIQPRNVAATVVTADLPPFAVPGSRIDVDVASMGDSNSLQGGTLLMTPLKGTDGKVYALAQGPVSVEGFFASATGGATARKNFTTAGTVPSGATVERQVPNDFASSRTVSLALDDAEPALAERVAAAIGARFYDATVRVVNPGMVSIDLPEGLSASKFAAALDSIRVSPVESDRVIVDERTGTVVVGGQVTIGHAAITHGSLTITVSPRVMISQPAPFSGGTTSVAKTASVKVKETGGPFFLTPEGASVEQIAATLSAVGAKPEDVISIFEGLRAAGALHGKLIIK
jgi:flagellar P-ring protein FlgI